MGLATEGLLAGAVVMPLDDEGFVGGGSTGSVSNKVVKALVTSCLTARRGYIAAMGYTRYRESVHDRKSQN